jgi:hypothetical protein
MATTTATATTVIPPSASKKVSCPALRGAKGRGQQRGGDATTTRPPRKSTCTTPRWDQLAGPAGGL